MTSYKRDQELLDDIISNIKSAIAQNKPGQLDAREPVLELTEVITDESKISKVDTKNSSSGFGSVKEGTYFLSDEEITQIFKEVLRPYLKSWLNQNLPRIVKEVVQKEARSLFEKVKL